MGRDAGAFGAHLKALRETAGYTQAELATIAGLSVHAVSALERGERRRPHVDTVRALSAALDLTGPTRDALLGSARAPARATAVEELSNAFLPQPLTGLLGRDEEVETLRGWLADPDLRLITLVGAGGVGKTRLALELAHALASSGSRVVFVGLAAVRNHAFVAPMVAEALGVLDATPINLPMRARAACDGRSTLLVLDNFEQVLDAAPLIADLLASVAALRVLATSRAPLRLRGEREYVVGPLTLDLDFDASSVADLVRCPAVRLFVERVRDVQPDFRLTSSNGPTVNKICHRLDALPLALELAAPWIKTLTPEELLRRLEHDVLFSTVGPRDLPERQQTMNATVAWSYQLLAPAEQRAFRRLGALPGLFPIDAAAAVLAGREPEPVASDAAVGALAALMNKSLLQRSPISAVATCPAYQMLETVRAYAAAELEASGERDDALEGLVRFCLDEASLAAEGLVGPKQLEWLDRVREDLESYRGALARLIAHGRATEASNIAWSLLFFWVIRGHAAEGLRWYEQILEMPSLPSAAESRALVGAATMSYSQGELEASRVKLVRALSLVERTGDREVRLQAENMLGHVELAAGHLDAARDRFVAAAAGFRELGTPWGTGHATSALAWVALSTGDTALSERLLDEATAALSEAGPWFLMLTFYVRAVLAVRRGSLDEALGFVRESLTRVRDLHDKFAFIYALVPLAAVAALKGDDVWAARILGARDVVAERIGAAVVDKSVHDLTEQAGRDARARLDPEQWAQAYAAGRKSSIDTLLKDVDRALGRRRTNALE